ncbi:mitotic spindle checkpoint protein MAD1-like isoform X3 [Musa acuminata AAA Group]|uniref:mitotic spindle checkpoint protein MAD1-like isoform X3 n=1 Tax=Musa acuminata AAA Group TaxID=214697 RepID=UPI0031CEEFFA
MRKMFNNRSGLDEIGVSAACSQDRMHIEKLEGELRNCHQEIEYLQDQLNLRNVEAKFMAEHVESLELKLAGAERLNDKLRLISEELVQADSRCMILIEELKYKEDELKKSDLQIENLETSLLDSQCEIESLKLDITSLEQRCIEAERLGQQLAEEKTRVDKRLHILETQLQEMQQMIRCLENEKKTLFERNAKQSSLIVELDKRLRHDSKVGIHLDNQLDWSFLLKLREELPSSRDMCTSAENLGPSSAKLAAVTSQDEHVKTEIEKMAKQIHESDLLVNQLKEELREVKLKAKEEAEDLTQEMAELRYQFTDMLELESRRRALVEEASIRRVQDVEAQVQKEQQKSITALRHFQEVNKLAEKQSMEIRRLKTALENILDTEAPKETEALGVVYANNEVDHALEWHPSESY